MVGHTFLIDSGGGLNKLNSPLLLNGREVSAAYHTKATDQDGADGKVLKQQYGTPVGGVDCAVRPFDFNLYAYAATLNTYHARAARAKAKDIVGRPWSITGDGSEGAKAAITQFFKKAFKGKTFSEGMVNVWTDYETLGNGYLEVVPNSKHKPAEFNHVPATEVWMRLDELGFVQQKQGKYAHFRAFGVDAKRYSDLKLNDPLSDQFATSVIHFSRYSPFSPFYGVPSVMSAWSAVVLMTLVAEYNLQFFGNNAIPEYAVLLEGEWSDDAERQIQAYFRTHLKGQAHKTMVMALPTGGKVTFEKLTANSANEASFRMLRLDCRDEILHAHGVPPHKVGIAEAGKLGGNMAGEQMEEYKNSVVIPSQETVTARLDAVIEAGFNTQDLHFAFAPYDSEDRESVARVDATYLDRNVLTPNEVKAKRFPDLPPTPGGDEPLRGATLGDLAAVDAALGDLQKEITGAMV